MFLAAGPEASLSRTGCLFLAFPYQDNCPRKKNFTGPGTHLRTPGCADRLRPTGKNRLGFIVRVA